MPRKLQVFDGHGHLVWDPASVEVMLQAVINRLGSLFPSGDLSVALLADHDLARLHAQFLDDPSETDVITFPGDPDVGLAGEVCVSVDRALARHEEQGTSFSEELTLYLVHGCLHLAGLNDETERDCEVMRAAEHEMMRFLDNQGKIPAFSLENPRK